MTYEFKSRYYDYGMCPLGFIPRYVRLVGFGEVMLPEDAIGVLVNGKPYELSEDKLSLVPAEEK